MREDYSVLLSFQIWIVVIALYLCCWDDKDRCEICIVVCNAFIPFIKSLRVKQVISKQSSSIISGVKRCEPY